MKYLITILLLGFFVSSEAQNVNQSQVRQFNAVPAYRVFGRGSGVGSPSFIQLDSNHIPLLHSQGYYDGRFQPLGSYLSNITGLVSAGTNVSVTGSGTSASPYVINSTASGGVTGSLILSSTASLTLDFSNDYIFSGTASTWTLPSVDATKIGRSYMITIKNRGSGNITLNSNTGSTIYDAAAVGTITIYPGEAYLLMPGGTYFNVE